MIFSVCRGADLKGPAPGPWANFWDGGLQLLSLTTISICAI